MSPRVTWICVGTVITVLVLGGVAIGLISNDRSWTSASSAPSVLTAREIPACVSPHYDYVCRDIEPDNLNYMAVQRSTTRTDDEALFERFMSQLRPRLAYPSKPANDLRGGAYVTFIVYFHFDKWWARQMATAVICNKPMREKENECRNRNYYFSRAQNPEALANTILTDIVKTTPVTRLCKTRRASKTPPKKYCQ